jgi:hypothetical protein
VNGGALSHFSKLTSFIKKDLHFRTEIIKYVGAFCFSLLLLCSKIQFFLLVVLVGDDITKKKDKCCNWNSPGLCSVACNQVAACASRSALSWGDQSATLLGLVYIITTAGACRVFVSLLTQRLPPNSKG